MDLRYSRNKIHIKEEQQQYIKNFPILIAGCGIGSYIAECLLRMGFENLTIIDGDIVELSNLNRQNYVYKDLDEKKVIALSERLLAINPNARITAYPDFIDQDNLDTLGRNYKVAINALDFSSGIPFLFDEYMTQNDIPVLHPYNLGWAGFLTVITAESYNLSSLEKEYYTFELNMGKFIVESMKAKNIETKWFEDFLGEYDKIAMETSPPQLSLGLYMLSGMVCHVIFDIAMSRPVKVFPESYYLSVRD